MSGETVIVGANEGLAAYIFTRSNTSWLEEVKLQGGRNGTDDNLGFSVSISADTAVVGARADNEYAGAVYIFTRSNTSWTEEATKLTASDRAQSNSFGQSVSLAENTVAVGAYRDDDDGYSTGSVNLFTRSGKTWSKYAKLTASDATAFDKFGASVSIAGKTTIIGAHYECTNGVRSGSVYIYDDLDEITRKGAC